MPIKISFVSASGGVGKTKIALLFSVYLRKYYRDKRVLLIDLDPTAGASLLLLEDETFSDACKNSRTMKDLLENYRKRNPLDIEKFVVRANIFHYTIDLLIPSESPEDLMFQMDKIWESPEPGKEFDTALSESGAYSKYDVIIIDTIPFFMKRYTALSTYISDYHMIVLRPSLVDLRRTRRMVEERILKFSPEKSFLVFNMVDRNMKAGLALTHEYSDDEFIKESLDTKYKPTSGVFKRYTTLKSELEKVLALKRVRPLGGYLKRSTIIDDFPHGRKESEIYSEELKKKEAQSIRPNIRAFFKLITKITHISST